MAKQYIWAGIDLPSNDEEKVLIWNELKTKNIKELKNGQFLFEFFKLGFSAIEIDSMVDLRPATIEKRCIEFLKQKEDNYEDFKFLFQNCKGLPKIQETNIYFRSNHLNLKKFCETEGIYYDEFKIYMDNISTVKYVSERIYEREIRLQNEKKDFKGKVGRRAKRKVCIGYTIKLG